MHDAQRPHQREGHGQRGNDGGLRVAQKKPDDPDNQSHGQQQFKLHVVHRGADGGGAVRNHAHFHIARQGLLQYGQKLRHAVGHADDVGPRLPLHRKHDGRPKTHAVTGHIGSQTGVFGPFHHIGHILEAQGSAVPVAYDGIGVFLRRGELVVGVNGAGAILPVKAALGVIDVGFGYGRAHVGQGQASIGQRPGIHLHAHGGALPARKRHQPHARQLRNLLGHARIHQVFQPGQGHGVAGDGKGDDGRVRRVDLVVYGGRGQVGRQQVVRRVDGGLHLLFRHVQSH